MKDLSIIAMNDNEGILWQNLENVMKTVHKESLSLRILHF